jgi:hypothetical protein
MAIDIREIELNDEQRKRIADLAEQTGRGWEEVLEEQLDAPAALTASVNSIGFEDRYIRDPGKRLERFREWASVAKSHNPNFDDSRESIYPDRA